MSLSDKMLENRRKTCFRFTKSLQKTDSGFLSEGNENACFWSKFTNTKTIPLYAVQKQQIEWQITIISKQVLKDCKMLEVDESKI